MYAVWLNLSAFLIRRGGLLYDNSPFYFLKIDTKGFSKGVDYFELSKFSSIGRQEKDQLCLAIFPFLEGMLLSRRQMT